MKEGLPLAPALERGIRVLAKLGAAGPMSLGGLAREMKIPKSSALRLLHTLLSVNMVGYDEVAQTYRSLVAIIPLTNNRELSAADIRQVLGDLARRMHLTAEWYVYDHGKMIITDREEPKHRAVHVIAQVGFVREFEDEFEAVVRVALGAGCQPAAKAGKYLLYNASGERAPVSSEEMKAALQDAARRKCAFDENYNIHGVRRYAAAVCGRDGKLLGVLALAENYTPHANAHSAARLEAVVGAASLLESKLARI